MIVAKRGLCSEKKRMFREDSRGEGAFELGLERSVEI